MADQISKIRTQFAVPVSRYKLPFCLSVMSNELLSQLSGSGNLTGESTEDLVLRLSELEVEFQHRFDICFCQSLSALVTSFEQVPHAT
mgnify:FL=1